MNPAEFAYEHNGRRVPDTHFYAVACDPRRSVAVEACAGAGKTWMLVSRIVRSLLEGCPAPDILAITFTKKAAGEMRERLHDWLEQFAGSDLPTLRRELQMRGVALAELEGAPGLALAQRLQQLQQELLRAGRPVQIRTFHSWFAALLQAAPLAVLNSLGLPASFELLQDDAEAVEMVWRRFYKALLNQPEAQADFKALVAQQGRSQAQKALQAVLARRVEFALADEGGVVEASVPPFDARYPSLSGLDHPAQALMGEAARQRWTQWAQALGRESGKTAPKAADAVVGAFMLDDAPARLQALRKALFVASEDRLTQHLVKFDAARQAEAELQVLLEALAQHEAWEHQHRMARLSRLLLAEFAALKREKGWVDMNDVERAARHMLADSVLSGWVQQRLDARVRQVLIDEFQDTNPLQWQALHAWLGAYAGAGGGSAQAPGVFIVGDPKQSIYRFRRAEPQVFRAARDFVVHGLGGDVLSCDHTRRNAPEVIQAVNTVMLAAQHEGEYSDFRAHTTASAEAGAVLHLPAVQRDVLAAQAPSASDVQSQPGEDEGQAFEWRDSLTTPRLVPEETLRALECRQAAHWLAEQVAAGLPPREVMVLSRRRVTLAAMEDALRQLGIPTTQPEKNDLSEAPEVQDVVALLDALVSPGHDLSLARALRSPLFGLSDADLVQLAQARQAVAQEQAARGASTQQPEAVAPQTWLALLQRGQGLSDHLAALGPDLALYQQWLRQLPPHDALAAIYHHRDVLGRYAASAPLALRELVLVRLRALLSAVLELDGARYATPYGVVRALKAGGLGSPAVVADAEQGGAVRLLTVHGAKGLEASVVVVLDTDAPPAAADNMTVLVDWPGEAPAPEQFVFLTSETRPAPSARDLVLREQTARQREELNGLYVALTRARHRLVLSSAQPYRDSGRSWWKRVQPLCAPVDVPVIGAVMAPAPVLPGEPQPGDAGHAVPPPVVLPVLPALPPEAVAPRAATTVVPPEPASLESRMGEAMHRVLEWAPVMGPGAGAAGWAGPEPARLAVLAREYDLDAAQMAQVQRMSRMILEGEGAWAWRADQIDWYANEVELFHEGRLLRLDRLVRHNQTGWWVLDYKSAVRPEHQRGLREQLTLYRAALQALNPGESVQAAFLTAAGEMVVLPE